MYREKIFLGLDLYSIFMLVGVIACMVCIRVLSDHRKLKASWQNLVLFNAVLAVILGYGSAVLFQAFYNFMESGTFEIVSDTGATFYGGLIGGTVLFIVVYFVVGGFLFKDGYHKGHFRTVSDMAAPCIAIAHGFGRLGCLMAGCCHGAKTDAWFGIPMNIPGDGTNELVRVIPVQLFEAVFLLALGTFVFLLFWEGKKYLLPLYMVAYSIWRFIAENLRADHRGETVVDFLTPSQLISVLLLVGGVVLFVIEWRIDKRKATEAFDDEEDLTDAEAEKDVSDVEETTAEEVSEEETRDEVES